MLMLFLIQLLVLYERPRLFLMCVSFQLTVLEKATSKCPEQEDTAVGLHLPDPFQL